MEVKYSNNITLYLEHKGAMFSFSLPNGGQIDDAIEACGHFLEALKTLAASKDKNDSTITD